MRRREKSRCKRLTTEQSGFSSEVARIIGAGGIAAIPTETSYGLAVDPFNEQALARLFRVKQRPSSKPVLVLVDKIDRLQRITKEIPPPYIPLIERYWPGPVTLIFPALPILPRLLTAGTGTVGVRISSNEAATEICRRAGGVITATSANLSGNEPARTAMELIEQLGEAVDIVVDAGPLADAPPSTVVKCEGDRLISVREGAIALVEMTGGQT